MSILGSLERRMAIGPTDDSWYLPGGMFYGGTSGGKTKSGANVSEYAALSLTVFWACVKILSEDCASLPLHLYRRIKNGGKERAIDHPLYYLLHDQPNPEMTSMSFRECGQAHVVTWGNSYCEIERGRGRISSSVIKALWPITPNRVIVKRDTSKRVVYSISLPGTSSPIVLQKRDILHVPGLGFNGIIGYSPVSYAREAIGLGLALEEYSELYFGQGTHPGVIVSHPGKLSSLAKSNLETSLQSAHSGLGKSHRLMLLEEAMKIEKLGIENKDAQFIESKKYSNIDIGTRIMRVPPYMYGEMEKSAWANVEQQAIDYVTKTLRPWLVRYEQALNAALLTEEERKEYFFEHLVDGLLRGDIKSRYEAYFIAKTARILTTNEIREMENRNPINGGDVLDVTPNLSPTGKTDPKPAPADDDDARAVRWVRVENAFHGVIADVIARVVRRESQRIRWILEKPSDRSRPEEFHRDFPGYIRKQIISAFLGLSESLMGVEMGTNGANRNGIRAEIVRFTDDYVADFATKYTDSSRSYLPMAIRAGVWTDRDADEIAAEQIRALADGIMTRLKPKVAAQ